MRRAAWLIAAWPLVLVAQGLPRTPDEYLRLMDANGDGKVSEAEYVQYMSRGFFRLDSNGDGVLEANELPSGHGTPMTLERYQDNLRNQFHRMDRNHDGFLSAKELAAPPQG